MGWINTTNKMPKYYLDPGLRISLDTLCKIKEILQRDEYMVHDTPFIERHLDTDGDQYSVTRRSWYEWKDEEHKQEWKHILEENA